MNVKTYSFTNQDELVVQIKDPETFSEKAVQILLENKLKLRHFEEISLGLEEIFYRTIDEDDDPEKEIKNKEIK